MARGLDRISATDIGPGEFRRRYTRTSTPVLLESFASRWPALNEWSNFDYFKERLAGKTVTVKYNDQGVFDYNEGAPTGAVEKLSLSIEEAVDRIVEDGSTYYVQQADLRKHFAEVAEDVEDPELLTALDFITARNVWFGGNGCKSPLHYDPVDNFLVQVVGKKRVTLFPPECNELLYQNHGAQLAHCSMVNSFDPDLEKYPLFERALEQSIEVVLAPGDTLFIPKRWWHAVETLETSVSVNFWWGRPGTLLSAASEFIVVPRVKKLFRGLRPASAS